MIILGIESSCDETAAAIVENGTKILSNVVASSVEIHKKYGGIIPEQAAREQINCIIPVIQESIRKAGFSLKKSSIIDAIAVTIGPGLIGSLLIGLETAKTLSFAWNKPIIPVNHLIAHIYANFLHYPLSLPCPALPAGRRQAGINFPALCLIVSGGHTELVLMKNQAAPGGGQAQFQWIAGTRDDAAGECFDKCSRLLGLGYPGGPAIEASASRLKIKDLRSKEFKNLKLPRPMINEDNFDFSFSGLKTAVLNLIKKHHPLYILNNKSFISYEIQEAIIDVLVVKTLKAAKKLKVKSILIGGGVAANQRLRDKFLLAIQQLTNVPIKLFIPEKKFCTDNAATIASTAFYNYQPVSWQKLKPNPSLTIN